MSNVKVFMGNVKISKNYYLKLLPAKFVKYSQYFLGRCSSGSSFFICYDVFFAFDLGCQAMPILNPLMIQVEITEQNVF